MNAKLGKATRWQLVAVPGLVPDLVFFDHLANRRFPVTWWIREEHEFDYIVEPDVFHDFFGHVPMLFTPLFADYMQAYGRGGVKAEGLGALQRLARLYWYTVEFGLIDTPQGLRNYGAGHPLVGRRGRIRDRRARSRNRICFDLLPHHAQQVQDRHFQETYFVIDGFQQLFDATAPDFTPLLRASCSRCPICPPTQRSPRTAWSPERRRYAWSTSSALSGSSAAITTRWPEAT